MADSMEYKTLFHFLSIEFGHAHIPFVLVGGFAVNYYGVGRATGDVDLLMADEHYQRALISFNKGGYQEVLKQHLFARLQNIKYDFLDLDVLFVDSKTFEGIYRQAREIAIENNKLKIPSFQHLIALKLHALKHNPSREVPDLYDIVNLLRASKNLLTEDQFGDLCLKFGTQDLYDKIKHVIWKN